MLLVSNHSDHRCEHTGKVGCLSRELKCVDG